MFRNSASNANCWKTHVFKAMARDYAFERLMHYAPAALNVGILTHRDQF